MTYARFLLLLILGSCCLLADNYREPDLEKDIFDVDKIKLNSIYEASLFSGLISVARDFDEEDDEVEYDLRSNALAIAGRLKPDNDNFLSVSGDLWERGRTTAEDVDTSRTVSKIYRGISALMKKKDNEDNLKLASYCADIALRLDEGAKEAKKLKAVLEEAGEPDWKGMYGSTRTGGPPGRGEPNEFKERLESIPGGKATKFAGIQSSVYALSVRRLSNGRHAGAASSLSATALRDKDVEGVDFHIDQKVGNMTGNSLEEIAKFMRVRHEEAGRIPSGYKVEMAFEDKDGLLDGPSAGTAMSLIIDALFTGNKLDERFACTGTITADGKVGKIGGVAGKIRGATKKKCTLVGVPAENAPGVSDIFVLDGIEPLINIQIFSLAKFEGALRVASADKPVEVQETIDDFNKIASLLKDQGEDALKSPSVISKLEKVVKAMPNHESARILLEVAKGTPPETLSVSGSFHHIDTSTANIRQKIQSIIWTQEFSRSSTDKEDAAEAVELLKELDGKVDPRLADYQESMLEITETYRDGRKDSEKDDEFVDRIKSAWEEVQSERKRLSQDPDIVEAG
jgi:hypothetical protein